MVKVRFAPSPTGFIHIGNTRIAFFNWLYALQNKGKFILRYDDTDQLRSKQEYIDAIKEDLEWLGIIPDEIMFQSKRFDRYDEITKQLKKSGLLYPCFETPEELAKRRKIQLSRKLAPIYDRSALKLTEKEKEAYKQEGRKPHWRFMLPNFKKSPFELEKTEISWEDKVRGTQKIDLSSMSDPILIREDNTYLYTLPSIIDDIDMRITDIIRGDDHVTNTAIQLSIFDALKAKHPCFSHINLLTTSSGEGLSKRKGDLSIRSLRNENFEPMAIASLATFIGTSKNVQAYKKMEDLLQNFNIQDTSKSAAKFDLKDLLRLNNYLIHEMPYDKVKEKLEKLNITGEKASFFWNAIRKNLHQLKEASFWWDIVHNENFCFSSEDSDFNFLQESYQLLPNFPLDENSWSVWTKRIQEKTNKKGKSLFKPLRFALTGQEDGPEFSTFLPLFEEKIIKKRLLCQKN